MTTKYRIENIGKHAAVSEGIVPTISKFQNLFQIKIQKFIIILT